MHIGKFAVREAVERIRTHAPPTKTDASSRLSVHYMTIDGAASQDDARASEGSAIAGSGSGRGSECTTVSRDTARVSAT
jgi:hypothetical protein